MTTEEARLYLETTFRDAGVSLNVERYTDQQIDYIVSDITSSIYLSACPGSGKTEVIAVKMALQNLKWPQTFAGIACTSFTRSAARTLNQRITGFLNGASIGHPHFVGTFDSWLHSFLLHPFGHSATRFSGVDGDKSYRLIDSVSEADFLSNGRYCKYRPGNAPIRANNYDIDHRAQVRGMNLLIKETEIQALTPELKGKKKNFWRDGFATYGDGETLSYIALRKIPELARLVALRFPLIIVDECQDLSDNQLVILLLLKNAGANLHFVGDLNQAIYAFREVDPQNITAFVEANNFQEMFLTKNFRSNDSIASLCWNMLPTGKKMEGVEPLPPEGNPCILWQYDPGNLNQLGYLFKEFARDHGLRPENCAILARGKTTLGKIVPSKQKLKKPAQLIASAILMANMTNRNSEDLTTAIQSLGLAIAKIGYSNIGIKSKAYCPPDISPIDWRQSLFGFIQQAASLYPFRSPNGALSWSAWCRLLKSELEGYWQNFPTMHKLDWEEVKSKIRSPQGQGSNHIENTLYQPNDAGGLRITTIHDVKGETFDAVMVVSADNRLSRGGHFSQWINPGEGNDEHQRFAYVAFSRPRHFLIVATPTLSAEELNQLTQLGFVPQAIGQQQLF